MKITSSLVAMRSQHTHVDKREEHQSLRIRQASAEPAVSQAKPEAQGTQGTKQTQDTTLEELSPLDAFKLGLLKQLLEQLTGIKIKLFSASELRAKLQDVSDSQAALARPAERAAQNTGGFAAAYDYSATHTEQESLQVDMSAQVTTSDGKTLNIGVQLNLSRQWVQSQELHLRLGDPKLLDPLVVNFQGSSAQLTQQKFQFDLNADGQAEQVSMLQAGSGFLALDKNGDGKINNGSELFGALSGNGFADLASYDTDGNRFIDAADPIFQQLKLWTKDANGQDQLLALGQAGIGAIYLGHIDSQFSLMDANQTQAGQLRESGFFLREDGSSGTVQQIDLVV